MEELKESDFVKTLLDASSYMTTKSDGSVETDIVKKEQVKSKWNRVNSRELELKEKYNKGKAMMWNAMHFQYDDPVVEGVIADKRYKKAKKDVAIIQLLHIMKDVINKGQFGARHDEHVTSLVQCKDFLGIYQGNRSVADFAATIVEHYKMQSDLLGDLAFGESLMLDIIAACKGEARSNITLETYYKGNKKEKAVWADKYKNNIVARLMILNCNDRSIRKKTDEAIRLGNGCYPTTIPEALAIIRATANYKKKNRNRNKNKKKWNNQKNNNNGDGHKSD